MLVGCGHHIHDERSPQEAELGTPEVQNQLSYERPSIKNKIIKTKNRAKSIAQWSRTLAALTDDLHSALGTTSSGSHTCLQLQFQGRT